MADKGAKIAVLFCITARAASTVTSHGDIFATL